MHPIMTWRDHAHIAYLLFCCGAIVFLGAFLAGMVACEVQAIFAADPVHLASQELTR